MRKIIKKLVIYLKSFLPTALPMGVDKFESFTQDIKELAGSDLDQVPLRDVKFVVATTITHQGPTTDTKSKRFFVKTLRAAAAKQVAGHVFQTIKQEQAAATAKQNAEAVNEPEKTS